MAERRSTPRCAKAERVGEPRYARARPGALEAELLFLTEILGAEVIDVRQHRVGTVRDLTVRVQEPDPVVTGVVVSRRRELAIPWSEVRTFAAATREVALRSTREDIERHAANPDEIWLAR